MAEDNSHISSVQNQWLRDPNARSLPQPPPKGIRTPNGIIWGHTHNDFYWIQRHPGVNVFTVWSRSMIQEFGENFTGEEHDYEPSPRVLRPWPVLKLPPGISSDPPLGLVDETCFCHHIRVPLSVDLYDDEGNLRTPVVSSDITDNCAHSINGTTIDGGVESSIEVAKNPRSDVKSEAADNATSTGKPEIAGDDIQPAYIHPVEEPVTTLASNSGSDIKEPSADKTLSDNLTMNSAGNASAMTDDKNQLPAQVEESKSVVDISTSDFDGNNQVSASSDAIQQKVGDTHKTTNRAVTGDKPGSAKAAEANTIHEAKKISEGTFVSVDRKQTLDGAESTIQEANQVVCDSAAELMGNASDIAAIGVPGERSVLNQVQALITIDELKDGSDGSKGPTATADIREPTPDALENTVSKATVEKTGDTVITNGGILGNQPVTAEAQGPNNVNEPNGSTDSNHNVFIPSKNKNVVSDQEVEVENASAITAQPEGSNSVDTTKSISDSPEKIVIDTEVKVVQNASATTDGQIADDTSESAELHATSVPKVCWSSIPTLEEFIPQEYFPDILLVNDPDLATSGRYCPTTKTPRGRPYKYKRVWPKLDRPSNCSPQIAHLNLDTAKLLGEGHHSYVYRAALRLPEPLSARSPTGEVTVAAKMAMPCRSAPEGRDLLENEGMIYNAFPKHLMEDWCGLNILPPLRNPVPVRAVVPKFYGYYVRDADDVDKDDKQNNPDPSPILLIEECGDQLATFRHSDEQRLEIYSSLLRLHHAGFLQQSLYARNILVQPGPLTKPPSQRSANTPSFRFIDFGRARWRWRVFLHTTPLMEYIPKVAPIRDREWYEHKDYEVGKAHSGTIISNPIY